MIFKLPGKKLNNKTDDELLSGFRSSGELEILGELFSRYMHLVYGVCLKYYRNREKSQDAVMQIFEKLIDEVPRHKIDNFRGWLHVVTRNFCLMQLRSERTESEKIKEWMNDPLIFMESSADPHPLDEEIISEQMSHDLEDCIGRLNEQQKNCIRQFYFENRCYNEIAKDLGLDVKKVKSYLQNGKRNLKLCLEEKNVRRK